MFIGFRMNCIPRRWSNWDWWRQRAPYALSFQKSRE
jgi:hypothetical protein